MKLLLAAFPPELGSLFQAPPPGWRVACTGVGAIQAAATTARLIAEDRPEAVLFIGSCGHYDGRLRIGDPIWAREALATSLSELRGEAYRPGVEPTRWIATLEVPLPGHAVAVPPAITSTREGAALLAQVAAVEHLELSGVYAACHAVEVPVGSALVVVNEVGPEAHDQWRNNHVKCSAALIACLQELGCF